MAETKLAPESAIHKLIKNYKDNKNYYKYIKLLLENGSYVNSQNINDHNNTPLNYAIIYNHTQNEISKIVELLLEFGADPNIKNSMGQTALHLAAFHNSIECMELLLKNNKGDPLIVDNNGRSCLYYLMENCDVKCTEIVKKLLSMKVDLYGNDTYNSPLMVLLYRYAYANAYIMNTIIEEIISMLLEDENININLNLKFKIESDKKNKSGNYETTPIHFIFEKKKYCIAKKMIKCQVDLDVKSGYSDMTLLELACLNDWPGIINLIIEKKNKNKEKPEDYNVI